MVITTEHLKCYSRFSLQEPNCSSSMKELHCNFRCCAVKVVSKRALSVCASQAP